MIGKSYLNEYIYTLLIKKNFDGFTVPRLRDELLQITDRFLDKAEPRKFIYRQLLKLERQGLLTTKGNGRKKTYHKTDRFREMEFVSKKTVQKKVKHSKTITLEKSSTVDELVVEKRRYEAELEIVLAEIEEYQVLAGRLLEHETELLKLAEASRESSVRYLAKINALNDAIKLYSEVEIIC